MSTDKRGLVLDSMQLKQDKIKSSLEKAVRPMAAQENLFLSDSDDEGIECNLCCKFFSSVQAYKQHLNSKKHYQKLTKMKLMRQVEKEAPSKPESHEENRDSQTELDAIDELYCDVCKKTICGYTSYMAHLKGSGHFKNLKQSRLRETLKNRPEVLSHENKDDEIEEDDIIPKPFAKCDSCEKTFYGPEALHQHLKGSAHKKKLQHMKILDSLKNQEDITSVFGDEEFECKTCHKCFSGPIPYKMHLRSSVHQKEKNKADIEVQVKNHFERDESGTKFICKECKKCFTDPFSFKSHLENNSHEKQKAKDVVFGFVSSNQDIVAVKALQNITSDEESDGKEDYQPGQYFLVCKLCHMSFSGPESARSHVESKNHIKVKREKKEMKILKQKMKQSSDMNGEDTNKTRSSVQLAKKEIANSVEVDANQQKHTIQRSDDDDDFELI